MKNLNEATTKRMRTFTAALCGIALCCGMIVPTAGNIDAYAEPATDLTNDSLTLATANDESAVTSSAATKFVGWYLSGIHPTLNSFTYMSQSPGVAYGYDASDTLVALSGVEADFSAHSAYIPADQLDSFLSASGLALYSAQFTFPEPTGVFDPYSSVSWWALYTDADPVRIKENTQTPAQNDGAAQPEAEQPQSIVDTNAQTQAKENPKDAEEPAGNNSANPVPTQNSTAEQPAATEADTLSTICRESEIDSKKAELEAQGYKIVRIEKAPTWWR